MALIPVEEARKIISNTNFEVKRREKYVEIFQALGKIAVEDILAVKSMPERSLSAMDGYAIKYDDYLKYGKLRVVGKLYPSTSNIPELKEGETYYVTTGSPLPLYADSVVPVENSRLEGEYVIFKGEVKKGKNIREEGEDINIGQIIIQKGTEITPYYLGILIQQKIFHVKVSDLKFTVFANGDEITSFENPQKNKIIDSISPILIKILEKFGSVKYMGVAKDDLNDVTEKIEKSLEISDVIISVGGSSVGEKDYVKKAVNKLGEVLFDGVSVNTIKRGSVGRIQGKPILILPGQVVSAITAFHEFGLSVLSNILGTNLKKFIKSTLVEDIYVNHSMDSVYLFNVKGNSAFPLRWGVGLYSELAKANGFAILKRGLTYKKGEEVELQQLI
ncbi:molybdopterin molybdenumtransferase MoeA [Saccharolobus solfataricus]|uniref:Molybdopterin biosynthesis protein (MoeA-1) n=3 Tax=Saccharolobus solfataricus TaxID=2287 RepID=Q7LXN4_SACS2|nr:molybdopterin molybdotransferase MoeA [Saccharolobus solfataricus]AAK40978.1 Molybdopterin biosynthesis protein (moeA-1) [Saccharolobus solfataricus P2]AKA74007.1 molybdopterin molybdenumtransferase MoeA [Saccharolobus solfataricus]AKA76704.1 molybdopterin molybdenumtransferase MoeA [Saccharolobus solfataricus]AKA79398.1 molybdopterin molybdenumtransferase MoeA [Saccharolobus solfataricus]AZF68485.1 molybdopterin molybdenumtransferase MoeA [Saccharolobus solfataricus]